MKYLALFLLTFLAMFPTNAQWTDNGTNTTTTDNVGIGTNSPNEKFEVNGNIAATDGNIILFNGSINEENSGEIRWNEYSSSNSNTSGAFITYNGSNNYLQLMTNTETTNYEHMRIYRGGNVVLQANSGNVGIGTTNPNGWKLAVNGNIRAKEIKVETGWSDFVFYDAYKLPTLREVENHIKEKGHLKDIPSATEVQKNGVFLGEMDAKLLQKIEELTLYTIQQQKEIESLKKENGELKSISTRLTEIEKLIELKN